MIGVSRFVELVERIAARRPTYRTGGVGKDGTCDCIGLIMGAMYEAGHKKYDMHSTNYFARYQSVEMKKADAKKLLIGQLLYRARTNQDKLNARYLPGGRYYTGDLLDYYHVGVVTSVKPLRIIECTEYDGVDGIMFRNELRNWQYTAKFKDVRYESDEEEGRVMEMYTAIVDTESGALNIREWPKDGPVTGKAPKGARVEVLDENEAGWPRIRYAGMIGYVSGAYLSASGDNGEIGTPEQMENPGVRLTIIDSEGNRFYPEGDWRVLIGSID